MAAKRATKWGRVLLLGIGIGAVAQSGCVSGRSAAGTYAPVSEKELAMRRLQAPLEQHVCKVAVYPSAERDWQLQRLEGLVGRGATLEAALECLCREGEGRRVAAIVDVYYARMPNGWSPAYEIHGTAVRFEPSFAPPPPPDLMQIHPPEMPASDVEPPPLGEGGAKTSARDRGKRPSLRNHAAIRGPQSKG